MLPPRNLNSPIRVTPLFLIGPTVLVCVCMMTCFYILFTAPMTGGFPRLAGMERKDLIAKNAEGMRDQAMALQNFADPNVKVVVVANPANTNALVAIRTADRIPARNFSALTRLDHERLRGFVAAKTQVHSSQVKDVAIFGNHSATQVPYINVASLKVARGSVEEQPLTSTWNLAEAVTSGEMDELVSRVQTRGAAIIQAQQASSALSAANAIIKHLRDWLLPEPSGEIFSMAVLSDGNPYGVPDGLVFSFPCRRTTSSALLQGDYEIVSGLDIDAYTQSKLALTITELSEEWTEAEAIVGSIASRL
jgi:malate dehydrogenase